MPRGSARRWIVNVLLTFAATVAVVAVFEIALRWLEPVSDVELLTEVREPQGRYLALRPNVGGLVLGRAVTVNADAYRGELVERQKNSGIVRILFFGDSHTFSMGADDAHTYPAVVGRKLDAEGCRCQVLNFGVPGQDLRQILAWLQRKALQYDPDLIVITFHSGDILESADEVIPAQGRAGTDEMPALYRLKVAALRHSFVARLVIPYGAAVLRHAFSLEPGITAAEQREIEGNGKTWLDLQVQILSLKRDLDLRGVALAFALFPSMVSFDDHPARGAHRALAAWLEAEGIPTVDLLPSFRGQRASDLTASLLDKHPNERGYAIAADAATAFVSRLIAGRAARAMGTQVRDADGQAPPRTPAPDGQR